MAADYSGLSKDELVELLMRRDADEGQGTRLRYSGQRPPYQVIGRVSPRCIVIDRKLSCGDEVEQSRNIIVEGENLQAMVSLYRYKGQVDLILTDPPYNTGRDFRYNDRWDEDPNDPDLGDFVLADDGLRHAKWLKFMVPRLYKMHDMLRAGGVLAICIDLRELFRLGSVLDSIFEEQNRLGIINWQRTHAPKNDRRHVSASTEYVLVYAKDASTATTNPLPRTEGMNVRYSSTDGDERLWMGGDITAPGSTTHPGMVYAIQSPFTGQLHYPSQGRHWSAERKRMRAFLSDWGSEYVDMDLKDGIAKALVIKGAPMPGDTKFDPEHPVLKKARIAAERVRDAGKWPVAFWRDNGQGTLRMKKYLEAVRQGIVPTTYWADEDYETPLDIGSTSWEHEQSGHSQTAAAELASILGRDVQFETVKPLRLFKKIIQIWCPPGGVVMDPFAGSGTAGHAVLELNAESGADRKFVLIEQGRPDKRDPYAKTLTAERVRRVIEGTRVNENQIVVGAVPRVSGGFRYQRLRQKVDAAAVLALEREEMVDLLLTTHWSEAERGAAHLQRVPPGERRYLFARGGKGEGFFLVWEGPDKPSVINPSVYSSIATEAKAAGIRHPLHIYASISAYSGPFEFYQIPNRVLERLGFSEASEAYGSAAAQDGGHAGGEVGEALIAAE